MELTLRAQTCRLWRNCRKDASRFQSIKVLGTFYASIYISHNKSLMAACGAFHHIVAQYYPAHPIINQYRRGDRRHGCVGGATSTSRCVTLFPEKRVDTTVITQLSAASSTEELCPLAAVEFARWAGESGESGAESRAAAGFQAASGPSNISSVFWHQECTRSTATYASRWWERTQSASTSGFIRAQSLRCGRDVFQHARMGCFLTQTVPPALPELKWRLFLFPLALASSAHLCRTGLLCQEGFLVNIKILLWKYKQQTA